jgi:hypothetical protein
MPGRADQSMTKQENVHYGAGLTTGDSWRNFDASLSLRIQSLPVVGSFLSRILGLPAFPETVEYGDIIRGLPVAPGSVTNVYCSHVLEHLSYQDARRALVNTYSMMAHGGTFRLVVPDLAYLTAAYNDGQINAREFLLETDLGREHRPKGLLQNIRDALGNSRHLWMWDYDSLSTELLQTGFTDIRRADIGNSPIEAFSEIENPERWLNCLGIECRKP